MREVFLSKGLHQGGKVLPHTFFSRSLSSLKSAALKVKLIPDLPPDSKLVLPLSLARLAKNPEQTEQYHKEIQAVLKHTASALESGYIKSVHVVSAAGLQAKTWGAKALEIEKSLFNTHDSLLKKQTGVYTFDQLIEEIGRQKFDASLDSVKKNSAPGSRWRTYMESTYQATHQATRNMGGLEGSIEYQQTEYAAILAMSGMFSHIGYMGNLSLAWAYLHPQYPTESLPIFLRVAVEKVFQQQQISASQARQEINDFKNRFERIVTNEAYTPRQIDDLMSHMTAWHIAYDRKKKFASGSEEEPMPTNTIEQLSF